MKIMTTSRSSSTHTTRILANRYEIIKKLGAGSYGAVYLAADLLRSKELCCLKEIFIGDLKPDETVGAVNEARLLCKLNHPGIVKFYNSFIDGEYFCIVTEFCEGGDLDVTLKKLRSSGKELDTGLLLTWFIQLLDAISYMHQRNVLHRDLKSKNIFLKNNEIKVGDFGISRILLGTLDQATTFTGTPYYMAPEVLRQDGYDSKSDIWSLGVVLYQMCCLKHAFDGRSLPQVIFNITQGVIPSLPPPPRCRKELHSIYKKLLSRDPAKRASAVDILGSKFILNQIDALSLRIWSKETAVRDNEAEEIAQILRLPKKKVSVDACGGSPTGEHQPDFLPILTGRENILCSPTSPVTPRKEGLTARDKMRYRKQMKGDIEAEKLKQVTASLYVENRNNYASHKHRQSIVAVPFLNNIENNDNNNNIGNINNIGNNNNNSEPSSPKNSPRRNASDRTANKEPSSPGNSPRRNAPDRTSNKEKTQYTHCFGNSVDTDSHTLLKRPREYTHCFGGTDDTRNSTDEITLIAMPQQQVQQQQYLPQLHQIQHCFGEETNEEEDAADDTGKGDSFEDLCRTNKLSEIDVSLLTHIPDDASSADTYYSTFDDFEDDSFNEESGSKRSNSGNKSRSPRSADNSEHLNDTGSLSSDSGTSDSYSNELDAVADCLQNALEVGTDTECPSLPTFACSSPIDHADNEIRQQKISTLRTKCVKLFGDEGFRRVYKCLEKARFRSDPAPSESAIMKKLRKIVSNPSDCFIVDQLLFLEKQR